MGKKPNSQAEAENNKKEQSSILNFDPLLLLTDQRNLEKICNEAEKKGTLKTYDKMKYKQNIYEVGDYLHLFDHTNSAPYVARLHSILKVPEKKEINAILKVEWLLRRQDLPAQFASMIDHFSVAQLFPSNLFEHIFVESIMRKCHVITYSEYEFLRNVGDTIHFTRAVFDAEKDQISPPPSEWERGCYCNMPVNPDLAYVQCEKCELWVHNNCVKEKKELECEKFVCQKCKKRKK